MAKGKKAKSKFAKDQDQASAATEIQAETCGVDDANAIEPVEDSVQEQAEPDVEPAQDEPVAEPAEKADEARSEQSFCLEDAVRALICDPKEHWMGSIKVRAGLMGMNIHQFYPMERWKAVFIAWGGHGILK